MRISDWSSDVCSSYLLQIAALDRYEIEGLGHNIDFVSAIMQHPRFRSGELTTGFIAEEYPEGFHGADTDEHVIRALVAIAGFMASAEADRARRTDGQLGDRLDPPAKWRSEEHTSELPSLMRNSYYVICLKKKNKHKKD